MTKYDSSGRPVAGVYAIRVCDNSKEYFDITGASTSNKARLQVYTLNGGASGNGNHQKFILIKNGDGSYYLISGHAPGKVLEWTRQGYTSKADNNEIVTNYNKTKKYPYCQQYGVSSKTVNYGNQRWLLDPTTYTDAKKNKVKCFFIRSKGATSYVMDVENGKTTTTGQDLIVYKKKDASKTDSKNQKFVFVPTMLKDKKISTPASIGLHYFPNETTVIPGTGGEPGVFETKTMIIDKNTHDREAYFCFNCASFKAFQIRYRYRYRKTGTNTWTNWSSYRNSQGVVTSEGSGWGTNAADGMWKPNVTFGSGGFQTFYVGKYGNRTTLYCDQKAKHRIVFPSNFNKAGGYDKAQYQIQVRAMNNVTKKLDIPGKNDPKYTLPYIGETGTSSTISLVWRPTATINTLSLTPNGIAIKYTSDYKGKNTIHIGSIYGSKSGYITRQTFKSYGNPYTGTVTVPTSLLTKMPQNGETLTFNFYIQSAEGASRTTKISRRLAFDSNNGLTIKMTLTGKNPSTGNTLGGGKIWGIIDNKTYPNKKCHIIYEQDGETITSECQYTNGHFVIVPPFGKDYKIMVFAQTSQKLWGLKTYKGIKINGNGNMFNFGDQYFRLFLQESPYSGPQISYSADTQSYMLQGDRRESVYFGSGAQVSQTVSGLVPIDMSKRIKGAKSGYAAHCGLEYFRLLRKAKYAVYRDLYGRRYDVAIMDTSEQPHDENLFSVSISMKERE